MDELNVSPSDFPSRGQWSPQQVKLAFHLYCQIPFGKLHRLNPQIVELAGLIGRSPNSLAMKLSNLASLDPSITGTGRKGLSSASSLDRRIWDEFHADWEALAVECEQLRHYLRPENNAPPDATLAARDAFALENFTGRTRQVIAWQRVKQDFFRRTVLASYHGQCCISGVTDKRLLVASHIVPWHEDKTSRLNPSNGLCLSAIHDKAFDRHLFSLSDDGRIVLSEALRASGDTFLQTVFWPIEDKPIDMPERFKPNSAFIRKHRQTMLEGLT